MGKHHFFSGFVWMPPKAEAKASKAEPKAKAKAAISWGFMLPSGND